MFARNRIVRTLGIPSLAVVSAMVCTTGAEGAFITFSASQGSLAASVTFDTSGTDLLVTLTNTSNADVTMQNQILTAVFFDVAGPVLTLDPSTGSAVLGGGSTVLFGSTDPGNVVGGEWEYLSGLSGSAPYGANYGISSAGFGIFGSPNFPGTNLQGPSAINGVQYGITSAGDDPSTGQPAVSGANALIQNSVVFTIPGLPFGFDPSLMISNVNFQYGTSLLDSNIQTPAPGAFSMLVLSALWSRRRARRA
jgi:hypothetical protein